MPKLAKWKRAYLVKVRGWSNAKLLNESFALAGGDDYDGCFTDRGQWLYDAMAYELDARLWLAGWMPYPFGKWGARTNG